MGDRWCSGHPALGALDSCAVNWGVLIIDSRFLHLCGMVVISVVLGSVVVVVPESTPPFSRHFPDHGGFCVMGARHCYPVPSFPGRVPSC